MAQTKSVEVRVQSRTQRVELSGGLPGPRGEKGDPGIYVSETPPPDPEQNDLWLDIS